MDNQKVLATVAGETIAQEDLNALIHSLPQEQQVYAANEQFQQQCLDQLITIHLLAKLGEDMKLEETEPFKKTMAHTRKEILAQLAVAESIKGITVTNEEAQAYYEANKSQFLTGETVQAKHILVATEDKCNEILEMITKGDKSFEDAAKELSTCPSGQKGGDLGSFGRGQMVKEFEDAAFNAEIGHIVGPVKTQFGYHLIKVEKKNASQTSSFENVADSIKQSLIKQKQNDLYAEKIKELKEKYVK